MSDTPMLPSPAAMRAAERIMAEGLADDPYDGGGYSPAHEKDIVLGIAAIIDAETGLADLKRFIADQVAAARALFPDSAVLDTLDNIEYAVNRDVLARVSRY